MTHEPADPGDVRFKITDLAEALWRDCGESGFEDGGGIECLIIDDKGEVVETHRFDTTNEAYSMVEAMRELQTFGLEQLLEPFGIEWQREQEERN